MNRKQMKRERPGSAWISGWLILCLVSAWAVCARGELPSAAAVLEAALDQLPQRAVRMSGSLRHRAPNGFVLSDYAMGMVLDQGAEPPSAEYRLRDVRGATESVLRIDWTGDGPRYHYTATGEENAADGFDPDGEIGGMGVTWSDLSFSFLRDERAQLTGTGRRLGRDCFVLSVPRPAGRELVLWIEQDTGRMLGAREMDASGRVLKDIRVVSVKQFDGLWMVKDLDIIHPQTGHRTTLRIDVVEPI